MNRIAEPFILQLLEISRDQRVCPSAFRQVRLPRSESSPWSQSQSNIQCCVIEWVDHLANGKCKYPTKQGRRGAFGLTGEILAFRGWHTKPEQERPRKGALPCRGPTLETGSQCLPLAPVGTPLQRPVAAHHSRGSLLGPSALRLSPVGGNLARPCTWHL